MTGPSGSAPDDARDLLFVEHGASWYWLLAGPAAGVAMLLIQLSSGLDVRLVVPTAFLVLVTSFLALQVKAARIHTSVELTADALRQGTETILVDEIVLIYPQPSHSSRSYYDGRLLKKNNALTNRALRRAGLDEADLDDGPDDGAQDDSEAAIVEKWQSSRALGELSGVPRGRTGIGLKLTGDRTAQAWARHHRELRAALTPLVEERRGPQPGRSS